MMVYWLPTVRSHENYHLGEDPQHLFEVYIHWKQIVMCIKNFKHFTITSFYISHGKVEMLRDD